MDSVALPQSQIRFRGSRKLLGSSFVHAKRKVRVKYGVVRVKFAVVRVKYGVGLSFGILIPILIQNIHVIPYRQKCFMKFQLETPLIIFKF